MAKSRETALLECGPILTRRQIPNSQNKLTGLRVDMGGSKWKRTSLNNE
jgi:hypothetical protein